MRKKPESTFMCHQKTLPIFDYSTVFTWREVVAFVLDLAGYTTDRPLHHRRLLEPAFGDGDFLLPAVERLLTAYAGQVPDPSRIAMTGSASNFESTSLS